MCTLPEIKGVTFSRNGMIFLLKDALLVYSEFLEKSPVNIIPVTVLYCVLGVVKQVELRNIPVLISGKTVYPISSQCIPDLHSRLLINQQMNTIRFQGGFYAVAGKAHTRNIKLLGISFVFVFE